MQSHEDVSELKDNLGRNSLTKSPEIAVCIAAYNEEACIGKVIKAIRSQGLGRVIVVDDGSNDLTSLVASEAGAFVLKHKKNLGQWAALKTAFRTAIRGGATVIVTFDGDGQHDPSAIQALVRPILLQRADVVIGSRSIIGNYTGRVHRQIGANFLNKVMFLLTGYRFSDCLSGLTAIRSDILQRLMSELSESQYGRLEFLLRLCEMKPRLLEVPAVFRSNPRSSKGQIRFAANLLRTVIKTEISLIAKAEHV